MPPRRAAQAASEMYRGNTTIRCLLFLLSAKPKERATHVRSQICAICLLTAPPRHIAAHVAAHATLIFKRRRDATPFSVGMQRMPVRRDTSADTDESFALVAFTRRPASCRSPHAARDA